MAEAEIPRQRPSQREVKAPCKQGRRNVIAIQTLRRPSRIHNCQMPTISKHTVGREQTLYIRRYLRVRGYAHLRSTSDRLCLPHTLHRSSPTSQFKSGLHIHVMVPTICETIPRDTISWRLHCIIQALLCIPAFVVALTR